MNLITKPCAELRLRMQVHHPQLTALIDMLQADFGARLLSVKSETAGIDVVARRLADGTAPVSIRIWPPLSVAEAHGLAQSRLQGPGGGE